MKKIYLLVMLCVGVLSGKAQLLFSEDFTGYTVGTNLSGQNSWTKGGSGPDVTVQNTAPLTYSGYNGGGGEYVQMPVGGGSASKVYKTFSTTPASGTNTFFYSFLLNISSVNATGDYFMTLGDPALGTNYFARVFAKSSGSGYIIGVAKNANVAAASFGGTVLNFGQTYLIVVRYSFVTGTSNDQLYAWINPSLTAEPNISTAEASNTTATDGSATTVGNILWHNRSLNNPSGSFDGIRVAVGATSADAWTNLNPSSATPTLSIGTLPGFGNVCINNNATNSFTITGSNLTTANVDIAALSGYSFSQSATGPFTSTLSLTPTSGSLNTTVYVQFNPTAVQSYNGNISINGGGVTTPITVAASGTGVNLAPTIATNSATAVSQTSADLNGTITKNGCSALTSYGIEYNTTSVANGGGTIVNATGLNNTAFTVSISALSPGTTYYYRTFATNGGGTIYGSEMQFTTLTPDPSLTATSLTGFGLVCTNATSNSSSFTLMGDNLTGADVTIGPLAGYTFATSANGTYSNTLTFSGYGSRFTYVVYVKFAPTAVQSYNGDFVISGGGTVSATNVAVTGAGVNSAPTVGAGSTSAITFSTATVSGIISNTGCTTVTAYGIEYSTTNNFANGAGTKVAANNLNGSNFSVNLTSLSSSTVYYYKVYATNGGGTTYGTQQSFTTSAPPPPVITATTLAAFGSNCINTTTGANSFTINGANLTNAAITVGPLAGYTFSTTANGTYSSSLSLPQTGGTYTQTVYVKFTPTASQGYNGNIPVSGGGLTNAVNVAASGTGVNTQATTVTGGNSNLTTKTATLAGSISANGCSSPTIYGIEYSGNANFTGGQGTAVAATNLTNGNFSVSVPGLVQGATYYYKAFATNAGGTAYGATMNFTVPSIGNGFNTYPVPAVRGRSFNFSMNNLKSGNYGLVFYNISGQRVYQQFYNVQGGFINENITIPFSLPSGVYQVQLIKDESVIATKKVSIL